MPRALQNVRRFRHSLPRNLPGGAEVMQDAEAREIIAICARMGQTYRLDGVPLATAEDVAGACIEPAVRAWLAWDGRGRRMDWVAAKARFAALNHRRWLGGHTRDADLQALRTHAHRLRIDTEEAGPPHAHSDVPPPDADIEAASAMARQGAVLRAMLARRPERQAEIVEALLDAPTIQDAAAEVGLSPARVSQVLASLRAEAQALPIPYE
jgi:DNA-directed RNA polymerase specialized sigma24 family protein